MINKSINNKIRRIIIATLIFAIVSIITFCALYQKEIERNAIKSVAKIRITSKEMKGRRLLWEDGYVDALVHIEADGYDLADDVCEIKVRGNSTLEADKLSYALRFKDSRDILGMGSGRKWVMLANAYDPTLLRNYIALSVAGKLRLDYTSECRFTDVWINDIYQGNYLITEPVQDGEDRVNIHTASGDFLIEYEKSRSDEDDTSYIVTDDGYRYLIHDPKHASMEQAEYVLGVLNHVEKVISEVMDIDAGGSEDALDTRNADTHEQELFSESQNADAYRERTLSEIRKTNNEDYVISKLSEVIDMDSFVDYCVFAELMKSVDMGFSSEYYYYKDGLLYAGPVWDYDMSAGNVNSSYYTHYSNLATSGDSAEGLWINEQGKLLKELMDCPEFEKLVWERYMDDEIQKIIENIYSDGGLIDEAVNNFGDSFERNYSEAGWEEGKQYFAYSGTPLPTYEENIDYLKKWFERRNEWLIMNHSK